MDGEVRRWSASRKQEVVLRLLRGESLEEVSREVRVPVSRLEEWRSRFLEGGREARKVSARTLRRWLRAYREGGFSGLRPKERRDRGRPRSIRPEALEKAVALREEVPSRSTRQIIDILVTRPGDPRGPRGAQVLDVGPVPDVGLPLGARPALLVAAEGQRLSGPPPLGGG